MKTRRWLYHQSIKIFGFLLNASRFSLIPNSWPFAKPFQSMLLQASWSVARATYLRRCRSVRLARTLDTGLRNAVRAAVMLAERGGKQQRHARSQKVSAGQTITAGDISSVARATYLRRCRSVWLARTLAAALCFVLPVVAMLAERGGKEQWQQLSQKGSVDKQQASSVHESERPRTAPKGTNRQPSAALPVPAAAPSTHAAALRRTRRRRRTTQTATWPQQAPPPHRGSAGGRPRSRCSDSSCAPPRLALYPLPALALHYAHHDRPCKQASGGLQPPLPPPRRGAAASSTPPSPVISPMPTATRSHFSLAALISTEISTGYRNYGMGP